MHHHGYAAVTVSTQSNPLFLRCQLHDNQKYGVEILQEGQGSYQDCEIFANGIDNVAITTGVHPISISAAYTKHSNME
ncbi:right-handed parallel beta-helix repeat-containing protein [Dictyobacter vulcani]|uniref:right-handed parallel beta-helix repeat-containing protein n=1 Tax=Dictyobacter vulcani TaxID=2607529 RepID=UPI0035310CC9